MSTVPDSSTPPPANNAKTTLLSSDPNLYVRPTAGGNASGDASVPGGATPGYSINMAGNAPAGGGPNIGYGATQIVAQPDATGHPSGDAIGGGTVGNSGDQGAAPASQDIDYASDVSNPSAG